MGAMADEIDRAQHYDELYREQALAAHFSKLRKSASTSAPFQGECIDCGEPIEPSRLLAMPNAVRCIECQTRKERRDKRCFR